MVENGASGADGAAAKRPRSEEADGAAGIAAAPPAKKPALSLEALEKAKKALQLQKELKEKLKGLPQVRGTPSRDQLARRMCRPCMLHLRVRCMDGLYSRAGAAARQWVASCNPALPLMLHVVAEGAWSRSRAYSSSGVCTSW